jgi:low affinity Fe/Cu permease
VSKVAWPAEVKMGFQFRGASGCHPYFCFSDARQLVVNTATHRCQFPIVFLIQNTQNRELAQFTSSSKIIQRQ